MGGFELDVVYVEGNDDDDLYGIMHLGRNDGNPVTVKILMSDHVKDQEIQRIDGPKDLDVDLYLVISRGLVARAVANDLDALLQRALVLTVMQLFDK